MPVSMMVPLNVSRSTMAAQSRGSVNVFVQPPKDSLEAMATLLEQEFGAVPVELHVLGRGRDAVHRFRCRFSRPRPPNRTCPLAEHPALHVIRWIRRGIR